MHNCRTCIRLSSGDGGGVRWEDQIRSTKSSELTRSGTMISATTLTFSYCKRI